ncbi:MAG: SdrD B-like domain-containing protein, partial [Acidobacteriota bacterium]
NYVWYDINKNGIQDPNEPPIQGVTVQLYASNVLLASTATNAVGQYYFNASNVAGGIQPGIAYEIRIALADAALGGKLLTIANAGTDLHDSDGIAVGGNAVAGASIPILGANDHTFDFGFADPVFDADLSITKRAAQNCVEPGDRVTYIVTVTNNGPAVATGVVVTDDLPFGLILDTVNPSQGSCNLLDPMTCNLGSLGVQQSATITITMSVPPNPPVKTFTNRATVTANEPDPNPGNNHAQATACLLVPGNPDTPVGPGEFFPTGTINDQKAGSVLFYNYYTSSASIPNLHNTRINMTNTNPAQFVFVHLFFIDGNSCSVSDRFVCLTANQTLTFLMSDQDPGTTGYLVGVAIDDVIGCPLNFNYLIGDAFIKSIDGHQANLAAESIGKIPGESAQSCDGGSVTTNLVFNGTPGNYERVPRTLAASSVLDYNSGNRALLIINRFGGDFLTSAATIPPFFGILYDDQEAARSFSHPQAGCQLVRVLSDSFPLTVPRFSVHVGTGKTGWLKFFAADDVGLMGAIINYNPNVATTSGAFNQGRNLHKLTFATSETIRVPVFPAH